MVSLEPLASGSAAPSTKRTWQEEYMRSERPQRFRVMLAGGDVYEGGGKSPLAADKHGFTQGELRAMRGEALGALCTWRAAKGSKVRSYE